MRSRQPGSGRNRGAGARSQIGSLLVDKESGLFVSRLGVRSARWLSTLTEPNRAAADKDRRGLRRMGGAVLGSLILRNRVALSPTSPQICSLLSVTSWVVRKGARLCGGSLITGQYGPFELGRTVTAGTGVPRSRRGASPGYTTSNTTGSQSHKSRRPSWRLSMGCADVTTYAAVKRVL